MSGELREIVHNTNEQAECCYSFNYNKPVIMDTQILSLSSSQIISQQQQNTYTVESYDCMDFVDPSGKNSQYTKYIKPLTNNSRLVNSRVAKLSDARSQNVLNDSDKYHGYFSNGMIRDLPVHYNDKTNMIHRKYTVHKTVRSCPAKTVKIKSFESKEDEKSEFKVESSKAEEKGTVELESLITMEDSRKFIMEKCCYFMRCKKYLKDNCPLYASRDDEDFDFEEYEISSCTTTIAMKEEKKDLQLRKIKSSYIKVTGDFHCLKKIRDFMYRIIIYAHEHHNSQLIESCTKKYKCFSPHCDNNEKCYAYAKSDRTTFCGGEVIWITDNVDFLKGLDLGSKEPQGYIAFIQK
jgi:hypothetical protein